MTRFLTAEWRHLAMLNYAIDPGVLRPLLPPDVELDLFEDTALVSMVGFLFLKTRVYGMALPGHVNFEEVNLRFYVRRRAPEGWRRGVVFVKEIVPHALIATVARVFYNEPYVGLPMRHAITDDRVEFGWRVDGAWNHLAVQPVGDWLTLREGTPAHFIAEHYWGYNTQRDGCGMEYKVEHPAWRYREVRAPELQCDVDRLYGPQFRAALTGEPTSAFLYEGSSISVHRGCRMPR